MNWSNRSKVVAGFCAVGGAYGIWRLLSDEKAPLEYKKRNDIEEEDIESEDENVKVEDRAKTGHGDQLRSSPDDVQIDQLLHLLRVSLPQYQFNPKSENNILIAIHELILKSRYFNNIEEMLDSGLVPSIKTGSIAFVLVTSETGPSLKDADVNYFSLDRMANRVFMHQHASGHPKLPNEPDVNIYGEGNVRGKFIFENCNCW